MAILIVAIIAYIVLKKKVETERIQLAKSKIKTFGSTIGLQ